MIQEDGHGGGEGQDLQTAGVWTDRLSNHWITLHQEGIPAGFKPLLVMDVWEHAYMRDYPATERKPYGEAFFRNIDWARVERRLGETAAVRPTAA
jgi:Fe-Mn family superoxide dismutase